LEIDLLLNRDAPIALAQCLGTLDCLYTVDVAGSCAADRLATEPILPMQWDYIFTDPRNHTPTAHESFRKVDELLRGLMPDAACNRAWQLNTLPPATHRPVRLVLPASAQQAAAARLPPDRSPVDQFAPRFRHGGQPHACTRVLANTDQRAARAERSPRTGQTFVVEGLAAWRGQGSRVVSPGVAFLALRQHAMIQAVRLLEPLSVCD
ncbi:MAG: hypothetical protein WB783_11755, partial [Arenicellales bacterium]